MGQTTAFICVAAIAHFLVTGQHTPNWLVVVALLSLCRDLANDNRSVI